MQHHDAITGTHSKVCGDDYIKRMNDAVSKAEVKLSQTLKEMALQLYGVSTEEILIINDKVAT